MTFQNTIREIFHIGLYRYGFHDTLDMKFGKMKLKSYSMELQYVYMNWYMGVHMPYALYWVNQEIGIVIWNVIPMNYQNFSLFSRMLYLFKQKTSWDIFGTGYTHFDEMISQRQFY